MGDDANHGTALNLLTFHIFIFTGVRSLRQYGVMQSLVPSGHIDCTAVLFIFAKIHHFAAKKCADMLEICAKKCIFAVGICAEKCMNTNGTNCNKTTYRMEE